MAGVPPGAAAAPAAASAVAAAGAGLGAKPGRELGQGLGYGLLGSWVGRRLAWGSGCCSGCCGWDCDCPWHLLVAVSPGNPNMDHRIPEPLVWYQMSSPPLGSENRKLLTSPPTCKHCVPNKNHNRNATKPFIFKARGDTKTVPILKINGLVAFLLSSLFFKMEQHPKMKFLFLLPMGGFPKGSSIPNFDRPNSATSSSSPPPSSSPSSSSSSPS